MDEPRYLPTPEEIEELKKQIREENEARDRERELHVKKKKNHGISAKVPDIGIPYEVPRFLKKGK